ncbi:MAG: glycerol-3-phosphate dehydrogenase [Lentisphaeria bacterium]|nr:glycerol-3-phosphate dehydrogenase [Lentisphaeria bacterium]
MSVITIIGSGMMGLVLAFPARENGNTVYLVGTPLDQEIIDTASRTGQHPKFDRPFPDGVEYFQFSEISKILPESDLIICGVSSFGVQWFADEVLPLLPAGVPVLSVTKGLLNDDNGNLVCYPQFWQQKLDALGKNNELCAIGGPCTSYELVNHDQTLVAFCGRDLPLLEKIKSWMATDYYHIITTGDVIGIEAAVALKNGYALAVALTVGENFKRCGREELHFNSQAAVFLQSSREMRKLVSLLGGCEDSFFVGIGDLYVTVYGGRTRKVGILLGQGLNIDEALEKLQGVTLESLVVARRVAQALKIRAARGEVDLNDYPLLMHVDAIVSDRQPVNIPWEKFTC